MIRSFMTLSLLIYKAALSIGLRNPARVAGLPEDAASLSRANARRYPMVRSRAVLLRRASQ
jgi:hypothetical protein